MLDEIFAQFAHDPNFDKKPADALSCDNDDDGSTLDHGRIADALTARQFITAGKATVTLKSLKSGARFTYRITAAKDENGDRSGDGTLFVGLLNGPNNDGDYKYLGRISREVFWRGRKNPRPGDISADAPSMKAFDWTWRKLVQGQFPDQLEVWHEGRCGRCGRKLTVPESIRSGFGPECIQHIG